MSDTVATLANPLMKNIGPSLDRKIPNDPLPETLAGATIVSADSHWEISEDIFFENFPAHMKDRAPRVWFDEYWHIGMKGGAEAFGSGPRMARNIQASVLPGSWDLNLRLRELDAENVNKEIIYPQSLLAFVRFSDMEAQENMYRIYNEWVAARAKVAPKRLNPVGVFYNWWDSRKAEAAMRQIVDLGLKVFMVPVNLGKRPDGSTATYADPEMETFWSVVEESGVPMSFHIGENPEINHRGGMGTTVLVAMDPFRKPLGQMIFGGVFDRHPKLKIVFAEGGIAWVPPALQDAELIFDSYGNGDVLDEKIQHRPTYYWHNNCYATFQNDNLGLAQLQYLGVDRIMWATDYPHSEGNYGYAQSSMQSVLDATTSDNAKKILGGNANNLYRLDS